MIRLTRAFLILNGLLLLGFGLVFLITPAFLGRLMGFTAHSPNALVEATAWFGGLQVGLAAFLFWSAARPERMAAALTLLAFVFLPVGLARAAGMICYGFEGVGQGLAAVGELICALGAWFLLHRARGEDDPPARPPG